LWRGLDVQKSTEQAAKLLLERTGVQRPNVWNSELLLGFWGEEVAAADGGWCWRSRTNPVFLCRPPLFSSAISALRQPPSSLIKPSPSPKTSILEFPTTYFLVRPITAAFVAQTLFSTVSQSLCLATALAFSRDPCDSARRNHAPRRACACRVPRSTTTSRRDLLASPSRLHTYPFAQTLRSE
jgi:hypothetical protein